MQKEPEGDSAQCGCVRACVRVHEQERESEIVRGWGVEEEEGVSVKIISSFSVRMNFTTVSSHEII